MPHQAFVHSCPHNICHLTFATRCSHFWPGWAALVPRPPTASSYLVLVEAPRVTSYSIIPLSSSTPEVLSRRVFDSTAHLLRVRGVASPKSHGGGTYTSNIYSTSGTPNMFYAQSISHFLGIDIFAYLAPLLEKNKKLRSDTNTHTHDVPRTCVP